MTGDSSVDYVTKDLFFPNRNEKKKVFKKQKKNQNPNTGVHNRIICKKNPLKM